MTEEKLAWESDPRNIPLQQVNEAARRHQDANAALLKAFEELQVKREATAQRVG